MTTQLPAAEDLREPPPPISRVLITCAVGVALIFTAFLVGLLSGAPKRGYDAHSADGVRVLLSAVGMLVIGSGVSLRPAFFGGWVLFAVGGLFGYGFGMPAPEGTEWYIAPPRDWVAALPNSWDSIQLLFGLFAIAGTGATIITNLSRRTVLILLTVGIAYHWSGIYSAVTSPPPTPWVTDVYWKRVSRPYLQIFYLNNAYQFYSPDPGPATEMWACVEYIDPGIAPNDEEAIKKSKEATWIYLPRRERDLKDPLGLSFYRRLAITENLAQITTPNITEAERILVRARRDKYVAQNGVPIRKHPLFDESVQFRPPSELAMRQIIPGFVKHIAKEYERPDKEVYSVKMYRVTHGLITLQQVRSQVDPRTGQRIHISPYDPTMYYPYFLGDFDKNGKLKDPTDGMLYWLLPILPKKATISDRLIPVEEFNEYYFDYVSDHAGSNRFGKSEKRPKE